MCKRIDKFTRFENFRINAQVNPAYLNKAFINNISFSYLLIPFSL